MRFLLLAACVLSGASWRVRAMDFALVDTPPGAPPAVSLRGEIVTGDYDRFAAALRDLGPRRGWPELLLDSPGGNIIEADDMANLIRRLGIGVAVADGEECASACFLLFAASLHRAAAPDARIGVHSASLFGDENLLTLDVTALMARDAAAFGVPPSVLGRMITTVPSDMAWLTDDELRQMNVSRAPRPAPGQHSEPRLANQPETRAPPEETAAAPASRDPTSDVPLGGASLSYRAGDARGPEVPQRLVNPTATAGGFEPVGSVRSKDGPAILVRPTYRPGT